MQNLEQFYKSVGANADEIIARLGGNASLVERFLGKFPSDKSFQELQTALENDETETAFRAAHTMKGICANLGLQTLFDKSSAITELLRGSDLESAKKDFPALEEEYNRTLEELKQLGIS